MPNFVEDLLEHTVVADFVGGTSAADCLPATDQPVSAWAASEGMVADFVAIEGMAVVVVAAGGFVVAVVAQIGTGTRK
nr:unnamed protein product [Haemonchus contortus]